MLTLTFLIASNAALGRMNGYYTLHQYNFIIFCSPTYSQIEGGGEEIDLSYIKACFDIIINNIVIII